MVTHEDFVGKRMLSFREQPYLSGLLERARDLNTPLTIVIGAGVSMNSGLRSWSELVDYMILQIEDEGLREMAGSDRSDLMRKAEIVLQLIDPEHPEDELPRIIREALYQEDLEDGVGQLALSIARLVAARRAAAPGPGGVRLVTTNFDQVVELALRRYFPGEEILSFGLREVEEWQEAVDDGRICVLHVHGIVEQDGGHKEPIVLTESQFFQYGVEARKAIYEALENSSALFVGLSMSDPNLVGPLYDLTMKKRGGDRFALLVPAPAADEHDEAETARYAIESSRFMERKLSLRTIFLKSYSQLNQVLAELSLAVIEPRRYRGRPADGSPSLVYGRRLTRKLDSCYRDLGCGRQGTAPTRHVAALLNERLYRALNASGGPVDLLRRFAGRQAGTIGRRDGENFALFLWLRARVPARGTAHYALNLVGTSAYVPRDHSAAQTGVPIRRDSAVTAAQAVFRGSPIAANSYPMPGTPAWRGVVATPIVAESTGSATRLGEHPVDVLTIGAIALHTTRFLRETEEDQPLSVISRLDSYQLNRLVGSMETAIRTVLPPGR